MAIQDDAKNFLLSALSRAGGDLPSLQLEWLATQGYTRGTIDDRWQAYLAANAYYLPEGLSRLLVGLNRAIGNNWTPNLLFQSGDILLWYDPSDLSTMFTNTTGTTQVAADGDSVALMLDKGGLSDGRGVVNRLVYSQQFDNAAWTKNAVTVTADSAVAPDGTTTADLLIPSTDLTAHSINQTASVVPSGVPCTASYYVKPSGYTKFAIVENQTTGYYASYNASGAGSVLSESNATGTITYIGDGWYRVTHTSVSVGASFRPQVFFLPNSYSSGSVTGVWAGDGTSGVVLWGAQLEVASSVTAYQVNGATVGGPGYHRVQATGTSMPKYKTDGTLHWLLYDGTDDGHATGTIPFNTVTSDGAARRNLLVEPDKFDHTTWTKTNVTATATSIKETTATGEHGLTQLHSQASGVMTCEFKPDGRDWIFFQAVAASPAVADRRVWVNIATGTVGTKGSAWGTAVVELVEDDYYRVSIPFSGLGTPSGIVIGLATGDGVNSYTGDTANGVLLRRAQLELGSTATDFQNIGTDEVAVCAGVTKSSDISGVIVEHSASIASNNGAFSLINVTVSPSAWRFAAKGTTQSDALGSNLAAPLTSVLTGQGKIATDLSTLRRDGVQTSTSATDQGTGNFGSYPMYFGRRGGASLPFNGREYQTVIRSRLLSAAELSSLETYVAEKTGVIL